MSDRALVQMRCPSCDYAWEWFSPVHGNVGCPHCNHRFDLPLRAELEIAPQVKLVTVPRIIKVSCCLTCPHFTRNHYSNPICTHEMTQDWQIPDFDEIPAWCQLAVDKST